MISRKRELLIISNLSVSFVKHRFIASIHICCGINCDGCLNNGNNCFAFTIKSFISSKYDAIIKDNNN